MDQSLAGNTILICGAGGLSGRSLARLCLQLGGRVVLSDRNAEADLGPELSSALENEGRGQQRLLDARPREDRELLSDYKVDLVITGPGVPLAGDLFTAAREARIPVRGENDFASEVISQACERAMLPAPLIIGVTGTDGKSTTVALLEHLVNEATGLRAIACGNFGLPLSQLALESFPADGPARLPPVLVVECSSFQLELVERFHPDVAVVLNIADDHLDRYPDRAGYLDAKLNIINCQNERDVLLAPRAIYEQAHARPYLQSAAASHRAADAAGPDESDRNQKDTDGGHSVEIESLDTVQVRPGRPRLVVVPTIAEEPVAENLQYRGRELLAARDFPLPGIHNQENLRFALRALESLEKASVHYLRGLHVNTEKLAAAIRSFRGLPHRMEICRPADSEQNVRSGNPDGTDKQNVRSGSPDAINEQNVRSGSPEAAASELDRILFLNDSKATTVQAVVAALASFPEPERRVFLLCGGRAKGADFGELGGREGVELFPFGEAGPQIAERTGTNAVFPDLPAAFAGAVQAARAWIQSDSQVEAAENKSSPGAGARDQRKASGTDAGRRAVVFLSPACASYDAYSSYEKRGEHFRELVQACRP